jgi:hypothetical protein
MPPKYFFASQPLFADRRQNLSFKCNPTLEPVAMKYRAQSAPVFQIGPTEFEIGSKFARLDRLPAAAAEAQLALKASAPQVLACRCTALLVGTSNVRPTAGANSNQIELRSSEPLRIDQTR